MIDADLNDDGIADNQQENIIRSVQNPTSKKVAGISIEESTDVQSIDFGFALDPEMLDPDIDAFQATEYGVIGYKLQMTGIGQTTEVTLYFQETIEPSTPWVCLNSAFEIVDCSAAVGWSDEGHVAVRSVTDGGEGDADGVANGVIVDFIAPGSADDPTDGSALSLGYTSDAADAAVAGCFIQSMFE
jgi:hypothetical protein